MRRISASTLGSVTAVLFLGVALAAPLAAGFGTNNLCVSNRPGGNNCTSNDLTFVLIGLGVQSDGCINPTDNVTIQLGARIRNSTAQTRYDIGIFIDRNNASAYNGTNCAVEVLHGPGGSQGPLGNFSCPPLDLNDTTNGDGPFLNTDDDLCGDMQNRSGSGCDVNPVDGFYDDSFMVLEPLTLSCKAGIPQTDGFVRIASCLTWGNNIDQVGVMQGVSSGPAVACAGPDDVHAGTNAKCRCLDFQPTDVPLPNLRLDCASFASAPSRLEPGETATYSIDYSNDVANCTPGAPAGPPTDPYGRFRCGTASFVRVVVSYAGSDAALNGTFFFASDSGQTVIPSCPTAGTLAGNAALVCNDTANERLIFAPLDSALNPTFAVVSPFAGSKSLPFQYRLDTISDQALQFTSNFYWDDNLDTDTSGSISNAEYLTLSAANSVLQNCSNCSCQSTATTTTVTLASFRATPDGRETRFDWSTETELGNIGFRLYALVGGERVLLHSEVVPTQGGDSLEPRRYSAFFAVPDDVEGYVLEDLDLRGRARAHGPFELDEQYGELVETEPLDWDAVRRANGLTRRESARTIEPRGAGRRGGDKLAALGATAALPVVELHVDTSGLYRVSYEQLLAAGFDFASASASQLGLVANGQPVPIYVSTTGKLGPGSFFEFWGEALDTLYTKTNVYRLLTGQKKPARAAVSSAAASGPSATSYPETRRFERNRTYAYWSSSPDPFFDTQMLVFSSLGQWPFDFTVDGHDPAGGAAVLRVRVFGGTTFADVAPDHHIQFLLNGTQVGAAHFDGASGVDFETALPAGLLTDGANTLTLRLPADTGAPFDLVALDRFEVTYPRVLSALAGRLDFSGQSGRFDVAGLPSADAVAYRRDGAAVTRLAGLEVAPDAGAFRATVPGSTAPSRYAVADATALLAPAAIRAARAATDLRTGPAGYLVISHAAFLDGLGALVGARAAQGHTVKLVDVEDVYAQFGGGIFDARAIGDYIAYAYRSMGTRYVLLVGGDTYDYHDYLGLAPISFVPSLYRETSEIFKFAPSDPSYADVDGDGVPDLAIGRFPVRTPQELGDLIAKTLQYDAKSYVGAGIFAADYADAAASESFRSASDRMIDNLPAGWQVDRIYMDQLALSTARSQLFTDLASGAALTTYLGHSGQISWGSSMKPISQRLFTVNDVAQLQNQSRPTAVVQFGCLNAYYNHPQTESLANRLVLASDRGAAAVVGATGLTEDAHANRYGNLLVPALAQPGATIGEAMWRTKQELRLRAPSNADLRDVLLGWTLLGDPALAVSP